MNALIQGNPWLWVVVLDPRGKEQFLGQHDEERHLSFIPVFLEKEQALQGLGHLVRDRTLDCEVQAIRYDDLAAQSARNGFMIFVLNAAGEILERIAP